MMARNRLFPGGWEFLLNFNRYYSSPSDGSVILSRAVEPKMRCGLFAIGPRFEMIVLFFLTFFAGVRNVHVGDGQLQCPRDGQGASILNVGTSLSAMDFTRTRLFPPNFCSLFREWAGNSPANCWSGRPHILITFFSTSHIELALNFHCSIVRTGIASESLLYIILDSRAFIYFSRIVQRGLLLEFAKNSDQTIGFFCRVKIRLLQLVLSYGIEVTLCDVDIVWFRNPLMLFERLIADSDVVLQSEIADCGWEGGKCRHWFVNIGVMVWAPSLGSKLVCDHWIQHFWLQRSPSVAADQRILCGILRRGSGNGFDLRQRYDGLKLFGVNVSFFVTRLHFLSVVSRCFVTQERRSHSWFVDQAKVRHETLPYAYHMACLHPIGKKLGYLRKKRMLFADNNRCIRTVRNFTFWDI
jgi:hypothetical protein